MTPESVPAAAHKGEDHQQQQADADEQCGKSETFDQEVVSDAAGFRAGILLGSAVFFIPLPLVTTLFNHLLFGNLTVKNDEIHRELLGTAVGVKEIDRKDEAGCQQRLIRMYDSGDVKGPTGQEYAEKFREPEHQT